MASIDFNANNVKPDEGRGDPIPNAWYNMAAKELKLEPTSKGDGQKITGIFEVMDGIFKGRKVYHNFNWVNPSEQAQNIGRAQFSALCHATRILQVNDTQQLLNIPFKAKVKVTAAQGGFDAKNEITAFKDFNDQSAVNTAPASGVAPVSVGGAPAARPVPPPPAAAAPGTAPAWGSGQASAPAQPWAQAPAAAPVQAVPMASQVSAPAQVAPPGWIQVNGQWVQDPNFQAAPAVQNTVAPAQTPVTTSAPSQAAAPVLNATGQAVPPWLQNQAG
jgi:hypothetical protein